MLNTFQQAFVASNTSSTASTSYATFTAVPTAASLRADAFPDDTSATNSAHTSDAHTADESVSSFTLLVILFCGLAFVLLSLLLYRRFPARVSLLLDQFSWKHSAPVDGSLQRKPTQFGAAFTLAFAFSALLLALYLGSAPNVQRNTALVPPSASPRAGTAAADVQITVRAFIGTAAVNAGFCPTASGAPFSPLLADSSGFTRALSVRSSATLTSDACVLAVDCLGCTLMGADSRVSLSLPYSAQLVEWEVRVTAAAPNSASRRYGVLTQMPAQLLDAQGQLAFTLTESFYSDTTTSPAVSGSGYELDFLSYSTVQPQSVDSYSSASRVGLTFVLNKSPVVFESAQSARLSVLQVVASVLSAVMSLLGVFGILFALSLKALPMLHVHAGHVVDERAKGGAVFIREDAQTKVSKYHGEEEEAAAHINSSDEDRRSTHIRVVPGATSASSEGRSSSPRLDPQEHAPLPQLVSADESSPCGGSVDDPHSGGAIVLSPSHIAAVAPAAPLAPTPAASECELIASPSRAVEWHIGGEWEDATAAATAAAASTAAPSVEVTAAAAAAPSVSPMRPTVHIPLRRPLQFGRLRLPKLATGEAALTAATDTPTDAAGQPSSG
jgi:hypothetical protein